MFKVIAFAVVAVLVFAIAATAAGAWFDRRFGTKQGGMTPYERV